MMDDLIEKLNENIDDTLTEYMEKEELTYAECAELLDRVKHYIFKHLNKQ